MQTGLYLIVFVVLLLFAVLFYLNNPYNFRELFNINSTDKSNLKISTEHNEKPKSKKVKFLNTGLERTIDPNGTITDKPIYIDIT